MQYTPHTQADDIEKITQGNSEQHQQAVVLRAAGSKHFEHYWGPSLGAVLEQHSPMIAQRNAAGADVFYTTGYFASVTDPLAQYTGRKQSNCVAQRSLFLDIDAKSQIIPTVDACYLALEKFMVEANLLTPSAVINSGNGLHAYWICDEDIPLEAWQLMADTLAGTAVHFGLKCDTQCTVDRARILRLPGYVNHKWPSKPMVELTFEQPELTLEELVGMLEPHIELRHSRPSRSASTARQNTANLFTGIDLSGAMDATLKGEGAAFAAGAMPSWSKLRDASARGDGCKVIQWAMRNQADVKYGLWTGLLSIARCTDDEDSAIVDTCSQHPDYDLHTCKAKAASFDGPRTCAVLEYDAKDSGCTGGCTGCPMKGQITTPLVLGYDNKPATPVPPAAEVLVFATPIEAQQQHQAEECAPYEWPQDCAQPIAGRPLLQHRVLLTQHVLPALMRHCGATKTDEAALKAFVDTVQFDVNKAAAWIDCIYYSNRSQKWSVVPKEGPTRVINHMKSAFEAHTGSATFYDATRLQMWVERTRLEVEVAYGAMVEAAQKVLDDARIAGLPTEDAQSKLEHIESSHARLLLKHAEDVKAQKKKPINLMGEMMTILTQHRQIDLLTFQIPMFNKVRHAYIPVPTSKMRGDENPAAPITSANDPESQCHIVGIHVPFIKRIPAEAMLPQAITDRVWADYQQHFPSVNDLFDMIVSARFARNRKDAYVWLNAESNFGKSVLLGCFTRLGMVAEFADAKEFVDTNGSKNSGKSVATFTNAWICAFDEFGSFVPDLKKMDNYMALTPKYGFEQRVALYTKLFFSADNNDALSAGALEAQIRNRFSKLVGTNELGERALVKELTESVYGDHLLVSIAQQMDKRVAQYLSMGVEEATTAAGKRVTELRIQHRIDKVTYKDAEGAQEKVNELADEFSRWLVRGAAMLDSNIRPELQAAIKDNVMARTTAQKDIADSAPGDFYAKETALPGLYKKFIADDSRDRSAYKAHTNIFKSVMEVLVEAGRYKHDGRSKGSNGKKQGSPFFVVRLMGYNKDTATAPAMNLDEGEDE